MAKTISCREVGLFTDCDEVMRGETEDDVMSSAAAHGRQAHGMTDEQLNDPRTHQAVRGFIREG
jgi:predicted small metal-binding protein